MFDFVVGIFVTLYFVCTKRRKLELSVCFKDICMKEMPSYSCSHWYLVLVIITTTIIMSTNMTFYGFDINAMQFKIDFIQVGTNFKTNVVFVHTWSHATFGGTWN